MGATPIEWADYTFNPVWGCVKVSPACDDCYAEAFDKRVGGNHWGPHAPLREFGPKYWAQPFKWDRAAAEAGKRARVFCASMADVFDNRWPERIRGDMWAVIRTTPNLDWMLLTKRPQNIAKMLPADWGQGWSNVWLGVTTENQEEADRRLPALFRIPARIHFISYEPALGPLNLGALVPHDINTACRERAWVDMLDWVIAGGERGKRPPHPDWFRDVRDQCAVAGTAFMFKQWGDWVSVSEVAGPGRHFSFPDGATVRRVGKKLAGRILDGREHNEFPTT